MTNWPAIRFRNIYCTINSPLPEMLVTKLYQCLKESAHYIRMNMPQILLWTQKSNLRRKTTFKYIEEINIWWLKCWVVYTTGSNRSVTQQYHLDKKRSLNSTRYMWLGIACKCTIQIWLTPRVKSWNLFEGIYLIMFSRFLSFCHYFCLEN